MIIKFIFMLFLLLSLLLNDVRAAAKTQLFLKGRVQSKLSLTIVPLPVATALPLMNDVRDLKVGTSKVSGNGGILYRITVESLNRGNLRQSGGTGLFPYTLKYGGQPVSLDRTAALYHLGPGRIDRERELTVTYRGASAASLPAGDYSDTLMFTITAR